MTLRQIAYELQKKGYSVRFRERKGGGIEITAINDEVFKNRKGNAEARKLIGEELTPYQKKHLQNIKTPKGTFGNRAKIKTPLPSDVMKQLKKVQRLQRKLGREERATTKNVRYNIEHFGIEETQRLLSQAERYAKGIAYNENVMWLQKRVEAYYHYSNKQEVYNIMKILEDITSNKKEIRETQLQEMYQLYYELEKGALNSKDFETLARMILNVT